LLVVKYERLVSHIVSRLITTAEDREDVCQEVFLRVFRSLSGFKFESKFSTWISRIAYNTGLNHLERRGSLIDMERLPASLEQRKDKTAGPEEIAVNNDISIRLQDEIEQLPPAYRLVLTLYHLEEFSYDEIADIMRLPMGTIKSHLFRARKLLKERLLSKYRKEEIWD
jgi:RNA polymerase sigma-70 factor (ECF subfamily)